MTVKLDQRHLYLQVIERLKKDIESGVFKENERFPSEFELARELGVSRATLREALRILEEEKVIIRKHGVGTFINPKPLFTSGIEQLSSVSTMIRNAGMEPGTIFMDVSETIQAKKVLQDLLAVKTTDLLQSNGYEQRTEIRSFIVSITFLSKNLPIGTEDLLNLSMFDAIEKSGKIRIDQAVAHIEPVGYDDEASSILRCGVDVPLLVLTTASL